jgi:hypothetical protein
MRCCFATAPTSNYAQSLAGARHYQHSDPDFDPLTIKLTGADHERLTALTYTSSTL